MGADSASVVPDASAAHDTTAPALAPGGSTGLLERAAELAAVDWLISSTREGPAALILEGEAGIGKTALWEQGVARALRRGHEVLCVRVRPADSALPFLALAELLEPVADSVLCSLAPPLATAVRALVLREPRAAPSDRRTVFTAVARALTAQAAQRTTIVAIDDLQWLDSDSADALRFAIHRLRQARIGLLLAQRVDPPDQSDSLELHRALPASRVITRRVAPLTVHALRQLLNSRADMYAARSQAARIHEVSAGNPLYALEIARLIASGQVQPHPGNRLPVPADIRGVVMQRLSTLPPASRLPLIAVAVMSRPTIAAVAAATDIAPTVWVDAGVGSGMLAVAQGRVAFTHPLFAVGVVDLALPEELRNLHDRIAGIVDDPEEHAVHLAQSLLPPDDNAATALAESARLASRRGARLAAAERFQQAVTFIPAGDTRRVTLSVEAAEAYRDGGNMQRAVSVATEALQEAPAGTDRARLLLAIASTEAVPDIRTILREALEHAGSDDALRARILNYTGEWEWLDGDMAAAAQKFQAAAAVAAKAGDAEAELRALGLAGVTATVLAQTDAAELLHRAQALEPAGQPADPWYGARHWLAVRALWHDDLAAAIPGLEAEYLRAEQEGSEFDQCGLTFHLAHAECRAGSLAVAARHADIGYELAGQFGGDQNLGMSCAARALTLACIGDADAARAVANQGLAAARAAGDRFFEMHLRSALTFLEVSLGYYAAAAEISAGMPELVGAMGIREPGIFAFEPDRIEALAALRKLHEARALTDEWERRGAELDRPRLLATAARCRALCYAAEADLSAAQAAAEHALAEHYRLTAPLELGRTLLVHGQILRRRKQKSEARAVLERARSIFAEAGASLWLARAQAELSRIGGRAPSPRDLTASERKIAEVVAAGATNREAAGQLFLSVSTVEETLSRVYRKLGVRSRTEMARIVRETPVTEDQVY